MRAKNEFKFIAETYEQVLKENISGERWGQEWDFSKFSPQLKQAIAEFENGLANMEDMSVFDLKDIVDEIDGANVLDDDVKEQAIGYLRQRAEAAGLEEFDLYGEEGIFSDIDGEGKRFRLVGVGGQHSQIENVEGEFDTIDELINYLGPKFDASNEDEWDWMEEIKDPQYWSSEGFEDNLLRFGIGEIYEVIDTQSADEYHPGYGKVEDAEDSITVGDIIDQVELDLPLTPDIADALQNVMDTVRSSLKYSPEDEEKEDNEDIDLTVDAGMSPQDRREAGEY